MRAVDLTVRCMVGRENTVWVAVCIDLCLAAQGDTREQAMQALHEQIALYVREAVTIHAEHADALLSRKAALGDRLRYVFWHAVTNRPRLRANAARLVQAMGLALRRTTAYKEPLPLQPA